MIHYLTYNTRCSMQYVASAELFLIHFASILPEFISTPLNILIFWLEVLITMISLLQI